LVNKKPGEPGYWPLPRYVPPPPKPKQKKPGEPGYVPQPEYVPPPPSPVVGEEGYVPARGEYSEELLAEHPGAAQMYRGEEAIKRGKELEYQYMRQRVTSVLSDKPPGIYEISADYVAVVSTTGEVKIISKGALEKYETGGWTWKEALELGLVSPVEYRTSFLMDPMVSGAVWGKYAKFEELWTKDPFGALKFGLAEGLISPKEYEYQLESLGRYEQLAGLTTNINKLWQDIYGFQFEISKVRTDIWKMQYELGLQTEYPGWKVTGWQEIFDIKTMERTYWPKVEALKWQEFLPSEKAAKWIDETLKGLREGPTGEMFKYSGSLEQFLYAPVYTWRTAEVLGLELGTLIGDPWAKQIPRPSEPFSAYASKTFQLLGFMPETPEMKEFWAERKERPGAVMGDILSIYLEFKLYSAAWKGLLGGIGRYVPYGAKIVGSPFGRVGISSGLAGGITYATTRDLEAALKSAAIAGAISGTFEAIQAFPGRIRYGKVTYPTVEGEKVAYRGIYAEWKEKAWPLIGRAKGKWAFGTPEVSFEGISLEGGWVPYTPLETKIVSKSLGQLGYSPEETQKILLTWQEAMFVKGLKPPYLAERILTAEHFADPERAREIILEWEKAWRPKIEQFYGSATAYAQMPPEALVERGIGIHDYDIMMKTIGESVDDLLGRLKAAGETVWISPKTPTLIETPMGHAVDIHSFAEALGYKVPEGAWGITYQQPPVKIGEIEAMSLGEFSTRKMGSILTLRPEGAYPELHRMKDITDFLISAKYLRGAETQTLKQLQQLWGISPEAIAKSTISLPPYVAGPPSIPSTPMALTSLLAPSFISPPKSVSKMLSLPSFPSLPSSLRYQISAPPSISMPSFPSKKVKISYPTLSISKAKYSPLPSYAPKYKTTSPLKVSQPSLPKYSLPSRLSLPSLSIPSLSMPPYSPPSWPPPSEPPSLIPSFQWPPGMGLPRRGGFWGGWFKRVHAIAEPREVMRALGMAPARRVKHVPKKPKKKVEKRRARR